ncbi:MAG: hypothetical protein NT154_01530 [Verrucomicrobia bacterium]|nr:hypothetical protein [Verrucomicrobiota bacterium]
MLDLRKARESASARSVAQGRTTEWIVARVQIGTAKGAKTVLHRSGHGH